MEPLKGRETRRRNGHRAENPPKEGDEYGCEACISGSQTRNLSDSPMKRWAEPGNLIHSDICGWIDPIALGESRDFLTFIDDATRMTYLLCNSTQLFTVYRQCGTVIY